MSKTSSCLKNFSIIGAYSFCIGLFFSVALNSIGFGILIGSALLQIICNKDVRTTFINFNKTHKLWLIVFYIVTLAFIGVFFCIDRLNAFSITKKYARLLSLLILPSLFIHTPSLEKHFLKGFAWTGAIYCLFKIFYKNINIINIIHTSVFIACICAFLALKTLTTDRTTSNWVYWLRLTFFLGFLFLINSQKTGPIALIISMAVLFVIVIYKHFPLHPKVVTLALLFSGFIIVSTLSRSTLFQRATNLHGTSYTTRITMLEQSYVLIKENPLHICTNSFVEGLKSHNFAHLGTVGDAIYKHAHPHNEWVLWVVQWGVWGLIAVFAFFSYILHYFSTIVRQKGTGIQFFYATFAILLTFIYIVSGCCEAIFFQTLPQSAYIFGLTICFSHCFRYKRAKA